MYYRQDASFPPSKLVFCHSYYVSKAILKNFFFPGNPTKIWAKNEMEEKPKMQDKSEAEIVIDHFLLKSSC